MLKSLRLVKARALVGLAVVGITMSIVGLHLATAACTCNCWQQANYFYNDGYGDYDFSYAVALTYADLSNPTGGFPYGWFPGTRTQSTDATRVCSLPGYIGEEGSIGHTYTNPTPDSERVYCSGG